jgi:flagellar hook assembly protein FlgD
MRLESLFYCCAFSSFLFSQSIKPTVAILDFEGQGVSESEVQTLTERGYHTVQWDGANSGGRSVGAGVYFCTLTSPSFVKTIKFVLLKLREPNYDSIFAI